ncbi:MAG: hypothetical protein H8D34_07940 [Chloroflexi bacterium]|nr:hypothetical protein [Chloroflexota bacterium]
MKLATSRPRNPFFRYWFDSWIRACGVGWTPRQVLVGYGLSILLPIGVLVAAKVAGLDWTWQQMIVAALIAWDMGGGVAGYNHQAMKRRRLGEVSHIPIWHHNLLHVHPLLSIFFNQPNWALALTLIWFISLFLYVEFLEVDPKTGKRRFGESAQKWVVVLEVVIALTLSAVSFWVPSITPEVRLYGIFLYAGLAVATFIILHTPLNFQRTAAVILMVCMIVASQFFALPAGFEWLLPIYLLKLLVGFTAKEIPNQD